MLNAIGLQNPGVDKIIEREVPFLASYNTSLIANISGSTVEEYEQVARSFNQTNDVHALEVNISCPNVKEGGVQFGTDQDMAANVTEREKKASKSEEHTSEIQSRGHLVCRQL